MGSAYFRPETLSDRQRLEAWTAYLHFSCQADRADLRSYLLGRGPNALPHLVVKPLRVNTPKAYNIAYRINISV
jgi:hypothetical protein